MDRMPVFFDPAAVQPPDNRPWDVPGQTRNNDPGENDSDLRISNKFGPPRPPPLCLSAETKVWENTYLYSR